MKRRISSRQFGEWIAFWKVEPFGGQYAELLHGIQCATIANTFRGSDAMPAEPGEFMPSYEPTPQSEAEMLDNLKMIGAMVHGDSR